MRLKDEGETCRMRDGGYRTRGGGIFDKGRGAIGRDGAIRREEGDH